MSKRDFQNGLVFLISFLVVFASPASFSYSRPPAKAKVKQVETAGEEDKSKDEIKPIVPASNITILPKPILVKPMRFPHRIEPVANPVAPQSLKFVRPPMLSEPIRVTTLTKPEPVKTEVTNSTQDTTTTDRQQIGSTAN